MEVQYAKADLVVARAGATTVAELVATNLPAIFIPFPFASDNHQFFNAKFIEENGGGKVVEDKGTPENKAEKIKNIINDKQNKKSNLDFMKGTNTVEKIVDEIKDILEKK